MSTTIQNEELMEELQKMAGHIGLSVEEYVERALKSVMLLDTIVDNQDRLEIKGPQGNVYFSTDIQTFFNIK